MKVYVALFRGINVGGRNTLPMAELKSTLAGLGAREVRTYIQSGNAVFLADADDPETLGQRIGESVQERRGFRPHVLVMSAERINEAVAGNPFPEAEVEPKSLHVYFLACKPAYPDLDGLEALASEAEQFVLDEDHFYLHVPDGLSHSKIAERVEKSLGVPATARNWRTVCKIRDMGRDLDTER